MERRRERTGPRHGVERIGPGGVAGDRPGPRHPGRRLGDRSSSDGVGLGLAVARGFVQAMDGEIRIEDTPGGGVTMVLSFEEAA